MVASYTANLAAFLTIDTVVTVIEDVEDLAAQTTIQYGVVGSGSTRKYFEVPFTDKFDLCSEHFLTTVTGLLPRHRFRTCEN